MRFWADSRVSELLNSYECETKIMNVGHSSDSTESELSISFSLQSYDFNTVSQPVSKFESGRIVLTSLYFLFTLLRQALTLPEGT